MQEAARKFADGGQAGRAAKKFLVAKARQHNRGRRPHQRVLTNPKKLRNLVRRITRGRDVEGRHEETLRWMTRP